MTANVGTVDRALRVVVGLVLLALALFGGHLWGWIGLVPLATGILGWCPFYPLLGMNTCPMKKA